MWAQSKVFQFNYSHLFLVKLFYILLNYTMLKTRVNCPRAKKSQVILITQANYFAQKSNNPDYLVKS